MIFSNCPYIYQNLPSLFKQFMQICVKIAQLISKRITYIIFSMYVQLIWSNSRLLKGVTILALMDMGYWFELIEMFLSWIWLTTVQPFSDVLIWTRIFIPVFSLIFLSNPMKLKTKQGCCLIRGRSKTTLKRFWIFFFFDHLPPCVDIFYGMN